MFRDRGHKSDPQVEPDPERRRRTAGVAFTTAVCAFETTADVATVRLWSSECCSARAFSCAISLRFALTIAARPRTTRNVLLACLPSPAAACIRSSPITELILFSMPPVKRVGIGKPVAMYQHCYPVIECTRYCVMQSTAGSPVIGPAKWRARAPVR